MVAEDGMTLHSHWFSGLLRTTWYCTVGGPGGPGGKEGSNGGGGATMCRDAVERRPSSRMPARGSSSVVSSCVTAGDRLPLCIPIVSPL